MEMELPRATHMSQLVWDSTVAHGECGQASREILNENVEQITNINLLYIYIALVPLITPHTEGTIYWSFDKGTPQWTVDVNV